MPTYQRPGVFVNEVLTNLNALGGQVTADAVAAFVGAHSRGPETATLVTSWSDFTSKFGDFSNTPPAATTAALGYMSNYSLLANAVYAFFANGGAAAWVGRVAHTDAVTATRTLVDTATPTPANTLRVDAYSQGAWGNSVYIDITAGYTAGRFNIVVYYGGNQASNIVETWTDLSMQQSDPRYAPAVVNSTNGVGGSLYIVLTDMLSTTVAPNNAPATQTGTALATGADGGAVLAADYATVYGTLAQLNQPFVLNLPGVSDTTTLGAAITFCQNNNGFLVVDPPVGQSVSQVVAFAASLTVSSYAAVYYPWLITNDPTKFTPGTTKKVPPGGAMVGQYLATDASVGPFKTPAGIGNRIVGAVDLETSLLPSDYDTLNVATSPVNAIKPVPGYGICAYGGRTLKQGYSDKYVAIRRSLIYLEKSLSDLTQFAVFQPNDARLWTAINSRVSAFLQRYYNRGGLSGATAAEAFYVKCDATNNTVGTVQQGIVNIEVGVALQYPAEFVVIRIGQFEGGVSVTNSLA